MGKSLYLLTRIDCPSPKIQLDEAVEELTHASTRSLARKAIAPSSCDGPTTSHPLCFATTIQSRVFKDGGSYKARAMCLDYANDEISVMS